jgi:hypothetical protein
MATDVVRYNKAGSAPCPLACRELDGEYHFPYENGHDFIPVGWLDIMVPNGAFSVAYGLQHSPVRHVALRCRWCPGQRYDPMEVDG